MGCVHVRGLIYSCQEETVRLTLAGGPCEELFLIALWLCRRKLNAALGEICQTQRIYTFQSDDRRVTFRHMGAGIHHALADEGLSADERNTIERIWSKVLASGASDLLVCLGGLCTVAIM